MFKLQLPTCVTFDNTADFKLKLFYQENKEKIVLYKALLTNRFGESCKAKINMLISPTKPSHSIVFSIIDKKKIYLTKAVLSLAFLQSDGNKIIVSYSFDSSKRSSLEDVELKKMTLFEKALFEEVANSEVPPVIDDSLIKGSGSTEVIPPVPTGVSHKPSDLIPYFDALKKEKLYLINEGGRKYKVSNGKYIGRVENKYSYIFDLETELHISDDAPISLLVGITKTSGTVVLCEDFQIVIVVNNDMGSNIGTAFINVEPWKLLEALYDRVTYGLENNRKMIDKLIEGVNLSTNKPIENIVKGQKKAVKMAMNEPVTIVWGPPGTGKTYTMAHVAIKFLLKKKSVLILSHSNVSVDGITKKIGEQFRENGKGDQLKNGLVLRYGYVRDDVLRADQYLNSFSYAASKDKKIYSKLESLQKEYEKIKATSGIGSSRLTEIHQQIKDIKSIIRKKEEECVKNAPIVATTISKAIVDKLFKEALYDVVIFDEVSMASVLQIMGAASFATEHLICVGDFMQLSPIVQSGAKKMGDDIFDFLGINYNGTPYYHPWLVMLDEQRRMHPAISKFSSINIYKRLLKDHSSVLSKTKHIVKQDMFKGSPINLIDLSTTYCATTKNVDNSRFNILSALLSLSIALKSESNVDSLSIITPYAAQTRLIRALLLDYKNQQDNSIRCATVHQFQGSESDVIIFDAVESYPGKKPGWLMSKDSDSIKRLINVAVTRARGKLVVVANKRFWDVNYQTNPLHTFYRLVNYISKEGNTVQHVKDKSLEKMIEGLSIENGPVYYLDNSYLNDLITDIKRARHRLVISFPSGNLDSEVEGKVYDSIVYARDNGVDILVKCNDCDSLPSEWKAISWNTNNAIFPIIMIDENVIWYGAPFADWKFVFKKSALLSPCKIACRVKGEYTAEIIRSFSDLDYIEDGSRKSPILDKGGTITSGGLKEYASHLMKCPGCGNYMKMTKGKSGKTILWCNDCKKTELLAPEDINRYINQYGVTCPKHNCYIEARLGQYGLYIKCDCGHTLKPEEI